MVAATAAEPHRRAGPYRGAVDAPGRISVIIVVVPPAGS
jgi:hypothetical protein